MKVAIYARVSTERQAERGTIGSQLAALRDQVSTAGHELISEFIDDGYSGARLDRPGLDALRDAAEAGLFDAVWCLSPDRLARVYAYQVLILDELARFGVEVHFTDAPDFASGDPQATLLTQVQGVIAEYEKAKIAERYRRGKLFRARAGEITTWKVAYGYRRVARSAATGPAHLEIYEPEAAVVRRIFADRAAGTTVRELCRSLSADRVPSPTGKATWAHSTLSRLLRNEAYVGRVYFNRTESVPDRRPARRSRRVRRDRADWIPISCPRIVTDEVFEAAGRVAVDNTQWSPRRAEPGRWLLRGLVKCGVCGVGTNCHKMRGRNGTWHRYYYCRNHDPLRAGGQDRRCPERNIRADALDEFVFDQIKQALLQPDLLLTGEHTVALTAPVPDDQLLAAELGRLDRKLDAADAEKRRLVDLHQAGLIELPELQRRAADVAARHRQLQAKRASLADQRAALARGNQIHRRVHDFAERIRGVIDQLDAIQKQQLLRLLIEEVRVTGWHVEIRLRIALDQPPPDPPGPKRSAEPHEPPLQARPLSSEDGLRSVGVDHSPLISDPRPALELGVVQWHTVAATARMSIRLRRVHARHSQPDWRTTIRRWCQQLALPGPPWAINNELASLSDGLGFCRVGGYDDAATIIDSSIFWTATRAHVAVIDEQTGAGLHVMGSTAMLRPVASAARRRSWYRLPWFECSPVAEVRPGHAKPASTCAAHRSSVGGLQGGDDLCATTRSHVTSAGVTHRSVCRAPVSV